MVAYRDNPAEEKSFLIQGFSYGFRIPYQKEKLPSPKPCRNHPSAIQNKFVTSQKLLSEMEKGRIDGPFDVCPEKLICSPLALVSKSEKGKVRLIHDLSYPKCKSVNGSIEKMYTEVLLCRRCSLSQGD